MTSKAESRRVSLFVTFIAAELLMELPDTILVTLIEVP